MAWWRRTRKTHSAEYRHIALRLLHSDRIYTINDSGYFRISNKMNISWAHRDWDWSSEAHTHTPIAQCSTNAVENNWQIMLRNTSTLDLVCNFINEVHQVRVYDVMDARRMATVTWADMLLSILLSLNRIERGIAIYSRVKIPRECGGANGMFGWLPCGMLMHRAIADDDAPETLTTNKCKSDEASFCSVCVCVLR